MVSIFAISIPFCNHGLCLGDVRILAGFVAAAQQERSAATQLERSRGDNRDRSESSFSETPLPTGVTSPGFPSFARSNLFSILTRKSTRKGVYKCNACTKPFTVTVGTVMEDSNIPLNKWVLAFALVNSSKKGFSAHQLHRQLGITYKSAWFMEHRIREAMKTELEPMGGEGCTVEVDETFIGKDKSKPRNRMAIRNMNKVVSLIDRSTGRATSFHVTDNLDATTISSILYTNVRRESRLITDEAAFYIRPGREFAAHESVNHYAKEYVRGDITTNTIERFFGIFKRGMKGIYQHCSSKHLQRYLHEFDFRYTFRAANGYDDAARTAEALRGARGERLMYRQPDYATV